VKTRVRVTLQKIEEEIVEIEVDHEPDEDPCDLTFADTRRAKKEAGLGYGWEATRVEVAS
jgi:hypothetical protein